MLKGNLEEFALADIFRLISWAKKTGKLEVERSAGRGKIFFREGEVYYAESSISREPLGQKLIRAGALSESHLMKALDANAQSGKRVGQILVESGWVTDEQLQGALKQQIEDGVFDLLRWELGGFEFESGLEADIEVQISVSVENLIIEASRRLDELEVIQRKIPNEHVVLRMSNKPPEGAAEINITPEEWRMLVLVDGTRSVHEIAAMVGMDDFGALRALYGLVSAGLVEVVPSEHHATGEGGEPVQAFAPEAQPDVTAAQDAVAVAPTAEVSVVAEEGTFEEVPQADVPQADVPQIEVPQTEMPQGGSPQEVTPEPEPVTAVVEPEVAAAAPDQSTETHPAPGSTPDDGSVFSTTGSSVFQAPANGSWDEATMSSVFKVQEQQPAEPVAEHGSEPVPAAAEEPVQRSEPAGEDVEGFDAPETGELVETKPDPFLNDLLEGDPTGSAEQVEPVEQGGTAPAQASGANPPPPAPSPIQPQVDRSTVVKELAGLFSDDEARVRPQGGGTPPEQPKRVEDDDDINKGLITRLIDGVKGL